MLKWVYQESDIMSNGSARINIWQNCNIIKQLKSPWIRDLGFKPRYTSKTDASVIFGGTVTSSLCNESILIIGSLSMILDRWKIGIGTITTPFDTCSHSDVYDLTITKYIICLSFVLCYFLRLKNHLSLGTSLLFLSYNLMDVPTFLFASALSNLSHNPPLSL